MLKDASWRDSVRMVGNPEATFWWTKLEYIPTGLLAGGYRQW
jgi:hypothetical protein